MKHIFEQKVFFADTDAYSVVWHGTYLRWMEAGRIMWCDETGHSMSALREEDIALPVVNINIRYKSSAKLDDIVIIETWLEKYTSLSATFKQVIKSKETGKVFGYIDDSPKGSNGFGYDPVFLVPENDKTMAELDEDTKNKISHRANALNPMLDWIKENLL